MTSSNFNPNSDMPLGPGDIVYLVEGSGFQADGPLTVKKGSISPTFASSNHTQEKPLVTLWKDPNQDPGGIGQAVPMSRSDLFTPDEVIRVVSEQPNPLDTEGLTVDDMVDDPFTHPHLVVILGGAAISRAAESVLQNPSDPQH